MNKEMIPNGTYDYCRNEIALILGIILCAVIFFLPIIFSGCRLVASVDPYDHGYAVGTAVYAGYTKIAADKDEAFKDEMTQLWIKVNSLQSTETLASDIGDLTNIFDKLISSDKLSAKDKAMLTNLRNMVLTKVDKQLAVTALKHDSAVKFLVGVRAGVNAMMALGFTCESSIEQK